MGQATRNDVASVFGATMPMVLVWNACDCCLSISAACAKVELAACLAVIERGCAYELASNGCRVAHGRVGSNVARAIQASIMPCGFDSHTCRRIEKAQAKDADASDKKDRE